MAWDDIRPEFAITASNSSSTEQDAHWMERALSLARATIGLASPNPQVGCVLVRHGVLVGEGAHLYEQRDHAEIVALKQAGDAARGSTAYVTLEPCSHHGRTGPCSNALIAAGIARCVVATVDPNPQVSGRGIARLKAAGVDVLVGVLEDTARELNDAFAFSIQHGRPFCTLKAALSVEGLLAPPPAQRKANAPHWLTGPESRMEVQQMRHASDALITGIGTVLADDPALTDRTGKPRRRPLLRVVLDTKLRIPWESKLARSADNDLLVICGAEAMDRGKLEALGVEVLRVPTKDGRLDLATVLDELGRRQILSALVEAGSKLNGAFLAAGLIQKVALFYSETELGEGAVPFGEGIGSPFLLEQRLHRIRRQTFGNDACVSGYLADPWAV